jgi:hypothetical protein
MYSIRPNLVIGFHGCDAATCNSLLNNPNEIIYSEKPYDWLGHGMYFWENNYDRAFQWAKDKKTKGEIKTPAVIGAVLYLGYSLDLLDSLFIKMLQEYYKAMEAEYLILNKEIPQNKDIKQDKPKDKIIRELDCTLIEYMHQAILEQILEDKRKEGFSELNIFDSTRGVFTEGGPAFPGAGIQEKNHIQICIRNSNCIKGFFLPRKEKDFTAESLLLEQKKRLKL